MRRNINKQRRSQTGTQRKQKDRVDKKVMKGLKAVKMVTVKVGKEEKSAGAVTSPSVLYSTIKRLANVDTNI